MGEALHRVCERPGGDDATRTRRAPVASAPARFVAARGAHLVCALAFMCACMLLTISRKSLTADEVVMTPSGYYHVAAAALALLLVVQAAYFFHSRPLDAEDPRRINESFPASKGAVTRAVRRRATQPSARVPSTARPCRATS